MPSSDSAPGVFWPPSIHPCRWFLRRHFNIFSAARKRVFTTCEALFRHHAFITNLLLDNFCVFLPYSRNGQWALYTLKTRTVTCCFTIAEQNFFNYSCGTSKIYPLLSSSAYFRLIKIYSLLPNCSFFLDPGILFLTSPRKCHRITKTCTGDLCRPPFTTARSPNVAQVRRSWVTSQLHFVECRKLKKRLTLGAVKKAFPLWYNCARANIALSSKWMTHFSTALRIATMLEHVHNYRVTISTVS